MNKNVFNRELTECSVNPMTGYLRDGKCTAVSTDSGAHLVCAEMNDAFLQYNKDNGNDLSTATDLFPGLKSGDRWCICANRYTQSVNADRAPEKIIWEATNSKALRWQLIKELMNYVTH